MTSAGSCGGLQGDVVFVLDASGSVGSSDFQTMLQFVNDLVDDFDIGTDLVRVGVVKFASSVYPEIDLHDHSDKTALKNTILGIAYTAGGTYTGKCPESLFPSHSLRPSLRPPPPPPPPHPHPHHPPTPQSPRLCVWILLHNVSSQFASDCSFHGSSSLSFPSRPLCILKSLGIRQSLAPLLCFSFVR